MMPETDVHDQSISTISHLSTTLNLLSGGVSVVIGELDAETSGRRHPERGLKDPYRDLFHIDKRVRIDRQSGSFLPTVR